MTTEGLFPAYDLLAMAGWTLWLAGARLSLPRRARAACARSSGGFSSLAAVAELFSNHWQRPAAWTHYLAFDLFVGA